MGLCPRLSQLQTASPRVAHLHAPLQLASSSCQYRTTAPDQQNRPDQGQPVETPQLEQLRVADFEELGAIVGRARELKSRCLVLLTRLTLGRQDQGDWPATVAEMRKRSKS